MPSGKAARLTRERRYCDHIVTLVRLSVIVDQDQPSEYLFGDCRISRASREVWHGDQQIAVEPKAFDLLAYLIANRERAVSKDELQDAIWPGIIVTEGALTRCVMKARRAIGDSDAIATVRAHGYRFVGLIDEPRIAAAHVKPEVIRDKPSIVVLPFVSIGGGDDEYLADGITDDVITELSRFRSLFVIARPSAFSYKGRNMGAKDVATELGVAYVVDGSVQRSGGRLRINVRLVDANADAQIWAERYDREVEDIFVVQEELAAMIAATVGGRVEVSRGRQRIDRAEFESYEYLLRALSLYYDYKPESNAEARNLLERSLEIKPDNARALAILAAVHSMDSWSYWVADENESRLASLEYGRRSIELDDSDSLAHALFGEILHDCHEPHLADHHFQRAIAINPSDIAARALYAARLSSQGDVETALKHLRVAERLDPFGYGWIPVIKASVMFNAGRYEEAIASVSEMAQPPSESIVVKIAALGQLGRTQEAQKSLSTLFAVAESEMPNFPGRCLSDWHPILWRMRSEPNEGLFDNFLEGLRLAGWE
jgi:TolB-like protein